MREAHGIEVAAIARLADILDWLAARPDMAPALAAVRAYREQYGA
ncbi:MAG TPA: hypothetical protein VFM15_08165 [Gammaproteobacteria bacterium]|nr:hypothetical protein [Gammaproteobacteria bacterium]